MASKRAPRKALTQTGDGTDWWRLPSGLVQEMDRKGRWDYGEPVLHDDLRPLYGAMAWLGLTSLQLVDDLEGLCRARAAWRPDTPPNVRSVRIAGGRVSLPEAIDVWTATYCRWWDAIARARNALAAPSVAAIMDGGADVAVSQRWTFQAACDLDALAGTLHPSRVGDDGRRIVQDAGKGDLLPATFKGSVRRCLDRARELRYVHATSPKRVWDRSPEFVARLAEVAASLPQHGPDAIADRAAEKSERALSGLSARGVKGASCWKAVARRLDEIRRSGRSFTSLRRLGDELGCSDGTVRKAIENSHGLRAWRVESSRARSTAQSARSLDTHSLSDSDDRRIRGSGDEAPTTDPDDVIFREIIENATPAERDRLHAMDPTQRRELAKMTREQRRDDTQHLPKRG